MTEPQLVLSCEHASAAVPPRWRGLFAGDEAVFATHRAFDAGALELGRRMARASGTKLHAGRFTRLLADLNRSPHNRRALFSDWTRDLPEAERELILARCWRPYREEVEAAVVAALGRGREVLHLSLHSFTPVLHGEERRVDVGLLYDPRRPRELALALAWREELLALEPALRVRRNQPYRGIDDGFLPWLRRRHPARRYAGIELEVNQALVHAPRPRWLALQQGLVASFLAALGRPRAQTSRSSPRES